MLLQLLLVAMVITNCFIHVVTSLVVLCLLHVALKLTTQCYSCSMLLFAVVIDVIIVAYWYLMVASSSCCLCFRCYKLLWSLHAINSQLSYFTTGERAISRQLLYYDKHTLFSVNILTTINLNIKQNPFCSRSRRHFLPFYKTRSPG